MTRLTSSITLQSSSTSFTKKEMQATTKPENQMLFLLSKRTRLAKPVRLKERYPEPQRQIPQKGLPQQPPPWRKGTRREHNP